MSCSPEGAQRLICQKQEERSQSPRCGLPRLATFGRDHKSGCNLPLQQRETASQQLDFKGPIREQTLCCGHLYVVQPAAAMCMSMIPKGPRSPMVPGLVLSQSVCRRLVPRRSRGGRHRAWRPVCFQLPVRPHRQGSVNSGFPGSQRLFFCSSRGRS